MIHPNASIADILAATGGSLAAGETRTRITAGIVTDSRRVVPGCCFVALRGAHFDGNAYAADAIQAGAYAVVVERLPENPAQDCAVILVADALIALQALTLWWRDKLEPLNVVGLTGSSGKTSTKDMVKNVLATRFKTFATEGNLNNHIGVPLSILATPAKTQVAVWEMGMNHAGELAPLCAMTRPEVGIITSIGSAHIEHLKTHRAIAEEKCTLARCLPSFGKMIYPATCEFTDLIATSTRADLMPVGGTDSSVRACDIQVTANGTDYTLVINGDNRIRVSLPMHGLHMVENSLLAAAAGWTLGVPLDHIALGLQQSHPTHGRLGCRNVDGVLVVDDTYNANPESMRAALETLATLPATGKRVAVLGCMGELGHAAPTAHARVGRLAAELNLSLLCAVGESPETDALLHGASGIPTLHAPTVETAAELLHGFFGTGDAVLFKASRSVGIERCMNILFPSPS